MAIAWEPTKPVNVIIGYSPGSTNELIFRKAALIVEKNNPNFIPIIKSKPGAGGVIGMNEVYESRPDGYTLGIPNFVDIFVANDIFQSQTKKFKWNSFTNVLMLGKTPTVIFTNSSSKINTPEEFIKLIQTTTKPINIAGASSGIALFFTYLMHKTGGNNNYVQLINYKNAPEGLESVIGNQTDFGILSTSIIYPMVKAGKVKIIAITGSSKLAKDLNVPILTSAVPGPDIFSSWGIILPPAASQEITDWYVKEFSKALLSEEFQEWAKSTLLITDKHELTPEGVDNYARQLRTTMEPVLKILNDKKE